MEPDIIDWSSIESIFVEDFVFEHFNAPKWVDLSAPDEFLDDHDDDQAWFCKPNCKHPKCAEDLLKPPRSSKVKILSSVTIPEMFPFKDRNRRNVGQGGKENKSSSCSENLLSTKKLSSSNLKNGDGENSNPNVSLPPLSGKRVKGLKQFTTKPAYKTKEQVVDDLHTNIPKTDRKPKLRNAFSARNLIGGRDILGQLTGICSGLKNLARRKSKKGSSENLASGDSSEKGARAQERERAPFLVVKQGTV